MFFSRNGVDVNINIICLFSYILISQGLIRPTLHPKVYFSLAQNCSVVPPTCENAPKNKPVWVMGNAWFPWQPIMRFSRMGAYLQNQLYLSCCVS